MSTAVGDFLDFFGGDASIFQYPRFVDGLRYWRAFDGFHGRRSPANVVVDLRRLNVPAGLISKVGGNPFGEFLVEWWVRGSIRLLA